MDEVLFSSRSEEWETPQELYNSLNAEFHFTVDAAATKENAKCVKYYTKEIDGTKQDWTGEVVWCNPPYGRKIADFVRKAAQSRCKTVMLIPSRTDTKWFHQYIYQKPNVEIRFIKGRIKFGGV